jgi:hypothetical protein
MSPLGMIPGAMQHLVIRYVRDSEIVKKGHSDCTKRRRQISELLTLQDLSARSVLCSVALFRNIYIY